MMQGAVSEYSVVLKMFLDLKKQLKLLLNFEIRIPREPAERLVSEKTCLKASLENGLPSC